MNWTQAGFEVGKVIKEDCFFSGPCWNTEKIKRFILRSKETGQIIESSYYIHLNKKKSLVNVGFEPSGSYGCPMGCLFCASGGLRPIKALETEQVANQVLALIDDCFQAYPETKSTPKYIFYVGIGEPTLITNQLINASKIISKKYPDLSFKIATMGAIPEGIIKFARSDLPFRSIQLSLPHWNENKLKYLFAKCNNYNLLAVLNSLNKFTVLQPKVKIKINYIGIKGYNDTFQDLKKTIGLLRSNLKKEFELKISCLNPNPVSQKNKLTSASKTKLEGLVNFAKTQGIKNVYLFGPLMSPEMKIGCGQLAGSYKRKTD